MLFYREAQRFGSSSRHCTRVPGSLWTGEDAVRRAWMLKCFVTGVTLLGICYCVVHVFGINHDSSILTACMLMAFLLLFIIWCSPYKRTRRQVNNAPSREPVVMTISEFVSPLPFSSVTKYHPDVPPRDCTPPPSYQEAVLAMVFMAPPPPPPPTPPLPPPSAQTHALPLYVDLGDV